MNSKRIRSLLLSAALLFVLFLSWFIGRSGELVNRYALNEVTYISRVTSLSKQWIVWYDDQLNIKAQMEEAQIDAAQALAIGEQNGIAASAIQFGWVKDRPAIIVEDQNRELALDAATLEKLMLYEKR